MSKSVGSSRGQSSVDAGQRFVGEHLFHLLEMFSWVETGTLLARFRESDQFRDRLPISGDDDFLLAFQGSFGLRPALSQIPDR